jgi:hypothetical protein
VQYCCNCNNEVLLQLAVTALYAPIAEIYSGILAVIFHSLVLSNNRLMSEYKFQPPSENSLKLVPFGKYKGQPVETMLSDRDYIDWVIAQPGIVSMLQVKFPALFNIITIGAPANDDSPVHNKLQAKFLDKKFQAAFIEAVTGKTISFFVDRINAKKRDQWEAERRRVQEECHQRLDTYKTAPGLDYYKQRLKNIIDEWEQLPKSPPLISASEIKTYLEFECGFDVLFYFGRDTWKIEIKPILGDDFPSVLRQIKRNEANVVLVGEFCSASCTLEEVRAIFTPAKIVTLDEIDRIMQSHSVPTFHVEHDP